jgi:lipopolysaccharide transport system permease protein/teichoic acid transport system permease protein
MSIIQFRSFLGELFRKRRVILELTRQDFRAKYLGSYLGILWAFVQPAVYICILWFVFQVGFKSAPVVGVPFIVWLMAGIVPWFFFNDALIGGTNSVLENSFLVKKMTFSIGMLPIIKILSAFVIHLFFLVVLAIMLLLYGFPFDFHWLQALYYLSAMVILLLGLSWLTSSILIFLRDMGQIVGMVLQLGFWMTPIFWSEKMLPLPYRYLIKLNPVYYIVEGYRDSFISNVWFWQHWSLTVYFWSVTGAIFVVGAVVFRRLRPHFADVI